MTTALPHWLALALAGLSVACTSPLSAEVLPATEPDAPAQYGFVHAPEQPRQRPPIGDLRLLASNVVHPRWAASDGRRLWLGEGRQLSELDRDYATRIAEMAVDDRGVVWLLGEDDRLTRVDPSSKTEPLPALPVHDVEALHVAGERLVVLGMINEGVALPPSEPTDDETALDDQFVLALSRDQGQTWELRRRPMNLSEFDDLSVAPDGSLQLMDGDEIPCGSGYQARWRSHLDRRGWTKLDWPLDTRGQRDAADHGWAYGYAECEDGEAGEGICAVDRRGNESKLLDVDSNYLVIHDGTRTMMLVDDAIWSVSGRKTTRVGEGQLAVLQGGVDGYAIARDGSVLVSVGATIHIGAATGWTRIDLE